MTDDDQRVPIEQVLPGFKLHPLDDDLVPVQAFVLIKSVDDDGDAQWSFRTSKAFNLEELLGALVVQTRTLERKLVRYWEDEDPDYAEVDADEEVSDKGGGDTAA